MDTNTDVEPSKSADPGIKTEEQTGEEKQPSAEASAASSDEKSGETPPADGAPTSSPPTTTDEKPTADGEVKVEEAADGQKDDGKDAEEPDRCLKKVAAVINQVDQEIEGDVLPGEGEDEFFVKYKN